MGKYSFNIDDFNIAELSINNFRVFANEANFKISPLTILTGTNSSGKSSFIKALKLLVRSYEKSGLRKLEIMETDLKLGAFNSILNSKSKKELIEFDIVLKSNSPIYQNPHLRDYRVKLIYNSNGLIKISLFDELGLLFEQEGDFQLEYKKPCKSFIRLDESILNKSLISEKLSALNKSEVKEANLALLSYLQNNIALHDTQTTYFIYNLGHEKFDILSERIKRLLDGISNVGITEKEKRTYINDEGEEVDYESDKIVSDRSTFRDLLPKKFAKKVPNSVLNEYFTNEYLNTIPETTDLIHEQLFSKTFSKIEFIDGVRATQELIYTIDNNPKFYHLLDSIYNSVESSFIEYVEYWLVNRFKILNLPEGKSFRDIFKIQQIAGVGYIITIYQNGINIGLSGLGYGIAQVLPIVLELLINYNYGKTYVIEEPESNLHPALQSQLADFFKSFINGDIEKFIDKDTGRIITMSASSNVENNMLIIETHSEYLIRKLQYFTAKGDLDIDKTIIYYFNPINNLTKDEEHVKCIKINKDGSLTDDFGTGFFDEADNIALELFLIKQSQNN